MKSWQIDDITELAKESKYTFYVPPKSVVEKLAIGNFAKVIFRFQSDDPTIPKAERMWVEIKERKGNQFIGDLANMPRYIKDLAIGDEIEFETQNIINTDIKSEEENLVEKYIHRCFVTNEISKKKRKIGYLYREEKEILGKEENGIYDSGWRIMAGDETQEYIDDKDNLQILSLGFVLNIDDTIIDLLEAPIGSKFEWDTVQKVFKRVED